MPFSNIGKNELGQLVLRSLAENNQIASSVTSSADQHEVPASEDIYARNGIKLVGKEAYLSREFYDQLTAHKLLKPIEQSLSITDTIDAAKIVSLAHVEAGRVPSLSPLLQNPELLNRLQSLLGDLKIPAALLLKLSAMQADRPKLFQHSLIMRACSFAD